MSLKKQLLIWVLGSLLTIGITIQIIVFWHTYQKFSEWQDSNLSYIAELVGSRSTFQLNRNEKRANPKFRPPQFRAARNRDFPSQRPNDLNTEHPAASVTAQSPVVINNKTNAITPNEDNNILQYQSIKDGIEVDIIPTRLLTADGTSLLAIKYPQLLTIPKGLSQITLDNQVWKVFRKDTPRRIIIVRQPMDWQKKLTLQTAWQAIVPILLTTLLLLMILPLALQRVLRPIQVLAGQMAQRNEQDLSPIVIHNDSHNRSTLPSELTPLVTEINGLLVRMKQYIQSQNRFIADAAHELRSPLTAISLQVQQLQKYSQDDSTYNDITKQQKLKQTIDKLAMRVEHNQHLVEQLLTLARIDAKQNQLDQMQDTQTQLLPVLMQVIRTLLPIADTKDLTLEVDNQLIAPDSETIAIDIDETSLFMLLKNLIQNAIIYTPNSGNIKVIIRTLTKAAYENDLWKTKPNSLGQDTTPVAIVKHSVSQKTSLEKFHQRIMIQVVDTGVGIDPQHYQQAFEPFVRLNPTNEINHTLTTDSTSDTVKKSINATMPYLSTAGTGLGLSIVFQICQQAKIDLYLSPTQAETASGLTVTLIF